MTTFIQKVCPIRVVICNQIYFEKVNSSVTCYLALFIACLRFIESVENTLPLNSPGYQLYQMA